MARWLVFAFLCSCLVAGIVYAQQGVNVVNATIAVTQSGTWTNTVTQATAANLNATVVGTGTFAAQATLQTQTDTVMVGGVNIKEINAVTPLMGNGATGTGSQRVTIASDNTAFSVNAAVTAAATSYAVGSIPPAAGTLASGAITSAMTGTTSTSLVGATSSNYIYVTNCVVSNGSTTVSTDILLQDGSGGTTLYVLPAPAATTATTGGAGAVIPFPVPLKVPTAGNALFAANVTTGSSTKVSCSGFKSTVSY